LAQNITLRTAPDEFCLFETFFKSSISLKSKKTHCGKGLECLDTLWYYKTKVKGGKKKTYIILMDGSFVKAKAA